MLLPLVKHHNLISHTLFQKEELGGVCGRIVRHRLHLIRELEQNPDCMDNALIRLPHGINAQIISTGNIKKHLLALQATDDL